MYSLKAKFSSENLRKHIAWLQQTGLHPAFAAILCHVLYGIVEVSSIIVQRITLERVNRARRQTQVCRENRKFYVKLSWRHRWR